MRGSSSSGRQGANRRAERERVYGAASGGRRSRYFWLWLSSRNSRLWSFQVWVKFLSLPLPIQFLCRKHFSPFKEMWINTKRTHNSLTPAAVARTETNREEDHFFLTCSSFSIQHQVNQTLTHTRGAQGAPKSKSHIESTPLT